MLIPVNLKESTIGEVARFNTNAISIFRKYNIDFYCKGKYLLNEACSVSGCNESAVLDELKKMSPNMDVNQNFNDWSIDSLIEYIIDNHHEYVSKTVPEIAALFQEVLGNPLVQNQEIVKASQLFRLLGNDMKQHMQKEELALFPTMKKLETQGSKALPIQSLISVVEMEHDTSGIIIKQLGQLCQQINTDGDETIALLLEKLKEFESDLIMHIHVENNVLHKKAVELEQSILV